MIGLFKKKDPCIKWLEELDATYTGALRRKNARLLEPYFTRKCLTRVVELVNSSNDLLCGLERYRVVNYTVKSKEPESTVYLKQITYKNVKMGYGVEVPVGEALNELWTVVQENGKYLVADIKGV